MKAPRRVVYATPPPVTSGMLPDQPFWSTARQAQQNTTPWAQTTLYKTVAAPTLLVAGGLLTFHNNRVFDKYDVQEGRQRIAPNFRTHADDYLIFSPIVAVYGLDALVGTSLGAKARHRFLDRTVRVLTASALSQAIIIPIKYYTHVERPDGSDFKSFPSGHTTQAFVGATFMHKELGQISPWYSIGAYTVATGMGVLRVLNNKHWLSDVLVGAGVGILSTNVAYLIFPDKKDRVQKDQTSHILIMPVYDEGGIGFSMLLTLH